MKPQYCRRETLHSMTTLRDSNIHRLDCILVDWTLKPATSQSASIAGCEQLSNFHTRFAIVSKGGTKTVNQRRPESRRVRASSVLEPLQARKPCRRASARGCSSSLFSGLPPLTLPSSTYSCRRARLRRAWATCAISCVLTRAPQAPVEACHAVMA